MKLSDLLAEASEAAASVRESLEEIAKEAPVSDVPWLAPILHDSERLSVLLGEARLEMKNGVFFSEKDIKELQGRLNHG